MSRRIADRIGFRFNNASAQPEGANIMDQDFAYQIACELYGGDWEVGPAERPQLANGTHLT
jgi:hypothetical protein